MTEKAIIFDRVEVLQRLFEGLPVSSDINLDYVVKLAPSNADYEHLRKQVINRYQYILNLKRQLGVPEPSEINYGLAMALVDQEVYEKILDETLEESEDKEVADHETGHFLVAENLGWKTKSATIVPGRSYRGLTEAVPQSSLTFEDFALEFAAISYGGLTAAVMMGHEVRGAGSDLTKARALARAVVQTPFSSFASEEAFLKEAQNLAHGALSRYGASGIHEQAAALFKSKTIT